MHSIAHHHGVTVNDVFLAAFAGALRAWPDTPWRYGRPQPVWTLVPVDLRPRSGEHANGNSVANLRIRLPCAEPDPLRRLAGIAASTHSAASADHVAVSGAAQRSFPKWLILAMARLLFSGWHISIVASNMPGLEEPATFVGGVGSEFVALGPLVPGHRLGAFLVSSHDQFSISVVTDDSLPDGRGLADLWVGAVLELAALRTESGE